MVSRDEVFEFINRAENLPSLPETTKRLLEEFQDPDQLTFNKLTEIVQTDPGLSATILKMSNSAFFVRKRTDSLREAISSLGYLPVKEAALNCGLKGAFTDLENVEFPLKQFWRRSLSIAYIADQMPSRLKVPNDEVVRLRSGAFLAGLFHDLGVLLFLKGFKKEFLEVLAQARASDQPLHTLEKERFGVTHQEVGGVLSDTWKFPRAIGEVCRFHHRIKNSDRGFRSLVEIVSFSDHLYANVDTQAPKEFSFRSHQFNPDLIKLAEEQIRKAELLS